VYNNLTICFSFLAATYEPLNPLGGGELPRIPWLGSALRAIYYRASRPVSLPRFVGRFRYAISLLRCGSTNRLRRPFTHTRTGLVWRFSFVNGIN